MLILQAMDTQNVFILLEIALSSPFFVFFTDSTCTDALDILPSQIICSNSRNYLVLVPA